MNPGHGLAALGLNPGDEIFFSGVLNEGISIIFVHYVKGSNLIAIQLQ